MPDRKWSKMVNGLNVNCACTQNCNALCKMPIRGWTIQNPSLKRIPNCHQATPREKGDYGNKENKAIYCRWHTANAGPNGTILFGVDKKIAKPKM